MRVEIYQNKDLSTMFGNLLGNTGKINRSNLVHVATLETSSYDLEESLDEVYEKTQSPHPLHPKSGITFCQSSMRSTSVGDVLSIGDSFYQVANSGFQKVFLS
jgi:hypothetical protein